MRKQIVQRRTTFVATFLVVATFFIAGIALTRAQQFQPPYPGAPAPDNAQLNSLSTLSTYLRSSPTTPQTAAGGLTVNIDSLDASAYLGAGWTQRAVVGIAGDFASFGSASSPVAVYGYSSHGPISYGVYGYAQGPGSTGVVGKTDTGLAGKFWGTVGVRDGFGGQYDALFDGDGWLTATEITRYTAAARDSLYMYVGGTESDGDWRIEKRSLVTGASVWSVESDVAGTNTALKDIAINGTYMYLVGWDESGSNTRWRIERRILTDGSAPGGFGTGGIVTVATAGSNIGANAIAIDDTYLYVGGFDNVSGGGGFHLEKRLLTNGNLCNTTENCDGIFDDANAPWAGGSGDDNGDGVLRVYGGAGNTVTDLVVDDTYIYLVGTRPANTKNWYIEKRLQSTGFLCNTDPTWGCGTSGFGDSNSGSITLTGDKYPQKIIFETTAQQLFIAGYDNDAAPNARWRIEKREIGGGGLCTLAQSAYCGLNGTAFNFDGILYVPGMKNTGITLASDDHHLYVAVESDNYGWRSTKYNAYAGTPNSWRYGVMVSGLPSRAPQVMMVTPTNVIIAGSETSGATTMGRIESRFIEKSGTASAEETITAPTISATANRYATPGVTALNGIRIEGDDMWSALYAIHGYNNINDTFGVYGYSKNTAGLVASSTAYNATVWAIDAKGTEPETLGGVYAASPAWNAVATFTANPALYQVVAETMAKPPPATQQEINNGVFAGVYATGGSYAGYFDGLMEIANGSLTINDTQLTEARLIDLLAWCGPLCQ